MTEASPESLPQTKGPKRRYNKKKIVRHHRDKSKPHPLKDLWADPVWRAWMIERIKACTTKGRVAGQPDGMKLPEFKRLKALAIIKTKKVMAAMAKTDDFEPDNKIANAAIEACVDILNMPGALAARMSAAKTLLEFTQRKPQTASAITLKTAETFLDEIVANDSSTDSNS